VDLLHGLQLVEVAREAWAEREELGLVVVGAGARMAVGAREASKGGGHQGHAHVFPDYLSIQ
jgi:hypothetical protein